MLFAQLRRPQTPFKLWPFRHDWIASLSGAMPKCMHPQGLNKSIKISDIPHLYVQLKDKRTNEISKNMFK